MSNHLEKASVPFAINAGEGYIAISLAGALDANTVKAFTIESVKALQDPYPYVVINCDLLTSLSIEWLREMIRIQKELTAFDRSLRLIHVKPTFTQCLKREGLDTTFKISASLREALTEFGLVAKRKLDTDFINPFLDATLHVLNVQASIVCTPGKIALKNNDSPLSGDVSGVIGIVSETFNGSVVISFPESTFLKIMSNMLGEEYTSISKEIVDGAGEITNMIFGQAKIVLNEKGYGIKAAIPSVVSGKNHTLQALTKGPVVLVPFSSSAGNFFVEICLSN